MEAAPKPHPILGSLLAAIVFLLFPCMSTIWSVIDANQPENLRWGQADEVTMWGAVGFVMFLPAFLLILAFLHYAWGRYLVHFGCRTFSQVARAALVLSLSIGAFVSLALVISKAEGFGVFMLASCAIAIGLSICLVPSTACWWWLVGEPLSQERLGAAS
jgi:hypothetical protein